MFGRTIRFFSSHIYNGSNAPKMVSATVIDFITFAVNALPIVIVAEHEDNQRTGTPEQLYTAFIISLVMGQVLPRLRNLLLDVVAVDMQKELSSSMHKECFDRPMEQHLEGRVGQLSQALFSNYMSIEKIVPTLFGEILPSFINTLGITCIIAIRYPAYEFATAIPFGLYLINFGLGALSATMALPARQAVMGKKHEFFGTALESVGSYTIAHQFGNVAYEVTKVKTILDSARPVNLRARLIDTATGLSQSFINYSGLIGFFIFTTILYNDKKITEYDFAAIGYLMVYISKTLDTLGPAFSELAIAYADAKNIATFHSTVPATALPPLELDGAPAIRFENVNFSYKSKDAKGVDVVKPILRGFNLEMKPRDTVAIVGDSGIGKSTILNLLSGFYKPDSGHIYIAGVDISTVSPESIRENITVISQDANLFNNTVKENVKYGKLDATEAETKAVASLAGLKAKADLKEEAKKAVNDGDLAPQAQDREEKIIPIDAKEEDLVDKMLSTPVGEKGSKISGGERQRVAFARACLRGGVILLADEPTAALDPKSEEQFLENLSNAKFGATTILVTHRVYTLTQVDRIYVIDEGHAVEEGSFNELLAKKGRFYRLLEAQCKELGINIDGIVAKSRRNNAANNFSEISITRNWATRMSAIPSRQCVVNDNQGLDAPLLVPKR